MSASAGRLGLVIVGTVVGAYFGQPQLGFMLGTALGLALFPGEGRTIEGKPLNDLSVSFSTYGNPIYVVDGAMEVGANFVWSTGLIEHRVKEEQGKGGGGVTTISFLYTSSWRAQFCEGVAEGILKIWADNKVVGDVTSTGGIGMFGFSLGATGASASQEDTGTATIRNYFGGEDQLPGPAEQADVGIENATAYRGQVGQECENVPLENFGNRIPNWSGLVAMKSTASKPSVIVDPDRTINSDLGQYGPPGEGYILSDFVPKANRLDFATQSVLGDTITYDSSDRCIYVDIANEMWCTTGFGGDIPFQVYEADTGKFLGGTVGAAAIGGIVSQFVALTAVGVEGPFPNGTFIVGANDKLARLQRRVGPSVTILRDASTGYQLSDYFPGGYPILGASGITVDTLTGDIWISYNQSGIGALYRIDGASLDPVEKITLGAISIGFLAFYEEQNSLIIMEGPNSGDGIIRFSLDSKTITSQISATLSPGDHNKAAWQVLSGHVMILQETLTGLGGFYDVSTTPMVRTGSFNPLDWVGGGSNWENPWYDPITHAIIVTGTSGVDFGKYAWLLLDRATAGDAEWRKVIERYSNKLDLVPGVDIDASAQTDVFPAYITRTRANGRRALEPGARAFNTRAVESDFKVKFPKGGVAPSFTILADDMGATAGDTPVTNPLERTSIGEQRFFETATINFIDPDFDYQVNSSSYKRRREAITVRGSLLFDFPGALKVNQAAVIIKRLLLQIWSRSIKIKTAVNWDFLLVDPGDVGTVTRGGLTHQFEVETIEYGADGTITLEGLTDVTEVANNAATGAAALGFVPQVIVVSGITEFFIMDIVLLRDRDDDPGVYTAAGNPSAAAFPGGAIFRSVDNTAYSLFESIISSRAASYGVAKAALGTADPDVWDRVNTLEISMSSGTLSSDTEDNVLNGANALLVDDEVIGFVTAVLNASGTYTISTLLRGLSGSEYAIDTHAKGDRVIALETTTVLRTPVDLSDLGDTFFYKSLTVGSVNFGAVKQRTMALNSQKPRAPAHLNGVISGSDWNLTAVRRSRTGGDWKNLVNNVPIGEATEKYEWEITIPGGTRVLTSTIPSVTYTEADQDTDFGSSPQSSLTWKTFQMSDAVGRGFSTAKTIVGA